MRPYVVRSDRSGPAAEAESAPAPGPESAARSGSGMGVGAVLGQKAHDVGGLLVQRGELVRVGRLVRRERPERGELDAAVREAPRAYCLAPHQRDRAEDPVHGDDVLVAAQDRHPGRPSQQERVEGAEESGRAGGRRPLPPDEIDQAVRALLDARADRGKGPPGDGNRDAGPFREVALTGRAVAGQVPLPQPAEGNVVIKRRRRRTQPVADQRVRLLAADHRPPHEQTTKGRQDENVHEGLPLYPHPDRRDALPQLPASQRPFRGQSTFGHLDALVCRGRGHAFLAQPARVAGVQRGGRQRVQPPVVLGADDVQRSAVEPRCHQERDLRSSPDRHPGIADPRTAPGSPGGPRGGPVPEWPATAPLRRGRSSRAGRPGAARATAH